MKKIIFFFLVFTFSSLSCTVVDTELFELVLEIKNQNQELLEEVKALQAKSDSLINELKNSAAKQEEVLKKVTDLQAELAKVLAQIGTLNQQLGAQNADLDEIKSQLANLQEKYQGILEQLEQLQKLNQILAEIEKLKGQLAELDGKYQVIQGSLTQNKEQLDALKNQVASLQAQLAENLTKISQLTAQLGEQGADIEKILAAIEELKASCAEIKTLLENQLSGKSPIPTNGLVGWWPFNGNANDESGNGNNGNINGPSLTSDRFGKSNSAFNFDGLNDYIRIPNSQTLNSKDVSISGWFKADVMPTNAGDGAMAIVGKWWDLPSVCNGNYTAYLVVLTKPQNLPALGSATSFYRGDEFYTSNSIESNKWIHFSFVHNSKTGGEIYINGLSAEVFQVLGEICNSTNPINIGADSNSIDTYRFFDGIIDDIAIWNRPLSAEEVMKIYKGEGF